jgi:hypothetical protein
MLLRSGLTHSISTVMESSGARLALSAELDYCTKCSSKLLRFSDQIVILHFFHLLFVARAGGYCTEEKNSKKISELLVSGRRLRSHIVQY